MDWTEKDVKSWKRADAGGVYYVKVPGQMGWKSSGKTKKSLAIDWALVQANGGHHADVTLDVYAKNFFIPGSCNFVARREQAKGKKTLKHWDTMRQVLEDYILPRWGRTLVAAITSSAAHAWLSGPLYTIKEFKTSGDEKKAPRPISTARRNTILVAFWEVMDQAIFDGIITVNPLTVIQAFSGEQEAQEEALEGNPETFTDEEIQAMFPADLKELDRIWGGRVWAALYMTLSDSAHRPSEILARSVRSWHPVARAFVVANKIDSRGKSGPLKSPRKGQGVKRKVALVGVRTADLIEGIIIEKKLEDDDLLFPAARYAKTSNQPMRVAVAGNHFCDQLDKPGSPVQRKGRTLYSLKHTAVTGFRTDLGMDEAALLTGHSNRATGDIYDRPEDAELVARALRAAGRSLGRLD